MDECIITADYGAWLVTCDPQDWEGRGISVVGSTLTCDAKCNRGTKEHSIRYLTPLDASSPEFEVRCFRPSIIDKTVGTMAHLEAPPSPISMLRGEMGKKITHIRADFRISDPKCQINIEWVCVCVCVCVGGGGGGGGRGGGCWIFFLDLNLNQGVPTVLLSLIVGRCFILLKNGHWLSVTDARREDFSRVFLFRAG